MALQITGQLTIGDANNIGNLNNYARLDIEDFQTVNSLGVMTSGTTEAIFCKIAIWKSKASYSAGKPPIQYFGSQVVNEIRSLYTIDSIAIATSPQSNLNSLPGKSLRDKSLYWEHQQVSAQIIADNPTFTVSIVDINL